MKVSSLLWCAALLLLAFVCSLPVFAQGSLDAVDKDGKPLGLCPLKHTDVKTEISGFLARVRVKQEFENNFTEKIEAVYTFPLSQTAAVDDMTMTVGSRIVRGKIMRREEAREVYETAKQRGSVAALLDQERPNIFTQSVTNILPGEKVTVEISYVETLKYDGGTYEFVFPTVVAPRYNPSQVADAQKISPPVAKTRAGHDISIEVNLDAGVPIENVASNSHQIETANFSASRAVVKLKNEKEIPNKDFVLRYDVSGKRISDAVLTHKGDKGGFFTLILQPPDNPRTEDVTPKEIVFVLDTSGSMGGFPIEKAKEAMKLALDGLYPNDTFNLITFAGDTHILFEEPVPATRENLRKAQEFLAGRTGGGGTEMMKAIKAALDPSDSKQHVRVVCFMTDGHVGNDNEIIAEVQKHPNARVFSFGIGSSTNRYLLDNIAKEGRGEAHYIALDDDGSAAAKRFHERVRSPMLTDISIDWNGLPVADVYPSRTQDLFSAKPVVVHGRFTGAAKGTIRLKGKQAGQEIVREIPVTFSDNEPAHDTLATLWARSRVDELTRQDYNNAKPEIKETITNLGLEFRLLTQFTSFVAVEELIVTDGGQPRRVDVPVELPEGMKQEVNAAYKQWLEKDVAYLTGNRITSQQIASLPISGRTFEVLSEDASISTVNASVSVVTKSGTRKKPKYRNKKEKPANEATNGEGVGYGVGRGSGSGNGVGNGDNAPPLADYFVVSGSIAKGEATSLIAPPYPPAAKAVRAMGSVEVQVSIDANGNVTSATAISGHPLLRAASVGAARVTKFKPVMENGIAVASTDTIVYNFNRTDKPPEVAPPTPEQQKLLTLQGKVSPTIFALIERLKNPQTQPAPDEAKFIKDGKAEVRVYLADKTPEAVEELKKLGFEVMLDPTTTKFIIGRIAVEKLAELAELKSVNFVAPQMQTK